MSLSSMVAGLDAAGVRFVVIGGLAAIVHGSPRMTNDLDICFDREPENLKRLAEVLASWEVFPRDFPENVAWEMDFRTLRMTTVLTLRGREGHIDIFAQVDGVGGYEECAAASEWADIGGHRVRVLSLPALIAAKRAAGRPKDVDDIHTLELIQERKTRGGPAGS